MIVKHDFHFEFLVLVNCAIFIINLVCRLVSQLLLILFAFVHSALQWACRCIILFNILLIFFIHTFLPAVVFLSVSVIFLFLTGPMLVEHAFSLVLYLRFTVHLLLVFGSLLWCLVGSYFFRVHFQLLNNYN